MKEFVFSLSFSATQLEVRALNSILNLPHGSVMLEDIMVIQLMMEALVRYYTFERITNAFGSSWMGILRNYFCWNYMS